MQKKILLVASHGGHWVQLKRISAAFDGMQVEFASTNAGLASQVLPHRFYVIPDANLNEKFKLMRLMCAVLWVMVRSRPDFVISTGAAPGFFALLVGKLFRAKTIWVDSCANAEVLSVSGQKAKWVADVWLTQWPHLASDDGAQYWGAVI